MDITASEYARKHGVHRNTVIRWIKKERLKTARRILRRLWVVDDGEPRPDPAAPWDIKKQKSGGTIGRKSDL